MNIFSWLTKKPSKAEAPSIRGGGSDNNEPTEKEIFQSPELLAKWTNKYFLEAFPLEGNYEHLPDDESRKDLNITHEQRERYIREIPALRIAGVSLLAKQYYEDEFWLKFSRAIYHFLYRHLYIEKYVSCAEDGDEKETSLHHMHRVYDDSDNFVKLLAGGLGYLSVQ